jgi:TonB-linked SusC/RagA family outer membrane protein
VLLFTWEKSVFYLLIKGVFMKRRLIYLLLCLIAGIGFAAAQTVRVNGSVISAEDNEPVIGATVVVKGTTIGTVTSVDGSFVLPNIPSGSTLVFSFIGYKSQEVEATGSRINVRLEPNSQQLEEVVVIAYGSQKKITVTGSVSNINNRELLKSPAPSLGNAIAGKLPGVQTVQYSGIPGADDPVIRVRGVSTFNGAEPLVLVDGVERPFSQIDANEVADITILKDASATAVFGVRGANSVILVTTKRGETGKPSVTATTSAGIQQITRFIKLTNSYTYATAYNNAQTGDGLTSLKFSDEAIRHFKDRDMLMLYPDTDWFDYLLDDYAWQSQHNVNVSGGNDIAKYFVSVGMLNQDGLFKDFDFDPEARFKYNRYNYRANIDLNLSKLSQLSVNVGGRVENRNFIGDDEQELFGYLQQAVPFSGNGIDSEGRRIVADPSLVGEYADSELGRVYRLGYVKQSKNVLNLDLQYQLKLDFITKGLDFKIKGSYNSEYTQEKNRKNGYGTGIKYRATIAPGGELDANGNPQVVLVRLGDEWPLPYTENKWGGRNWYAEAGLNYSRTFGNHNVGALALYNQSKTYYPSGDDGDEIYMSIPSGYVGFVGRVTYNYATRYLADINMGYNGSENFASGSRYGIFPSAALGWIPSSEQFWEPVNDIVSYLKLRVSLGKVGNDKTGASRFLYLPGVYQWMSGSAGNGRTDGTANFGTNNSNWLPGAREMSTGNPFVTWETATKQNYGFDMNLFHDKFSINFDYFIEDRKNILGSNEAILPSILGIQSNSVNYGHIKNHGYEVVLKWEDRIRDFYYSISPTVTFARSKVIDQMEVPQEYPHLSSTGYPVWQPFGYEFFEFYVEGETEKRYQDEHGTPMPDQGTILKNGDCVYVDLTGDGRIDPNDRHAIGYTDIPEYNASLNLSFSYKGFDLSMLWIGATNADRNLGQYYRPQWGATNNSALLQWVYDNSWRPDNAATATLPRLTFTNMAHNTFESRVWLVDASYIRLKNMEIGYTFRKIPGIPQIGSLRLYATGYNLLTFSKFKANDPESRGGGWPNSIAYPMTRVINLGVKVNF